MPLFGKNKPEEKKKDEKKSAPVKAAKKAGSSAKKSMKDLYGASQGKVSSAPAVKTEEGKPEAKREVSASSSAYRVLLRPLVTEKGSHLGVINKYVFEVDYNANKIEIAKAIETAYGIKPVKVNIIKLAGKVVRRGRTEGRRKNWKKAIVTLPQGKSIQIYEGI
jgi:large subunit ribosomal protein L23